MNTEQRLRRHACLLGVVGFLSLTSLSEAHANTAYFFTGEGAFHSDTVWQSAIADPCDRNIYTNQWFFSHYYEDVDWFRNPGSAPVGFFPQAQCQLRGAGFPYAPQVIECGTQGHCFRFGTGAGPSPDWNRSELVIGDNVVAGTWHAVSLRFKFPQSVPVPTCPGLHAGPCNRDYSPLFAQFFHQKAPSGRAVSPPPGAMTGLRLVSTPDGTGPHQWMFNVHHATEYADGTWSDFTWEEVVVRDFQPEQWIRFQMLFYWDPDATTVIYYAVDDEPWQVWSGRLGTKYAPELGGTRHPYFDMKVGLYSAWQDQPLKVYIDDISYIDHYFE